MTSVFDGMASVLNGVFGAAVTLTPEATGVAIEIRAVFREEPFELQDEDDRTVLTVGPTLRVQRPTAGTLRRGDLVEPGNGRRYLVGARTPGSGSPASDAFVVFDLEDAF